MEIFFLTLKLAVFFFTAFVGGVQCVFTHYQPSISEIAWNWRQEYVLSHKKFWIGGWWGYIRRGVLTWHYKNQSVCVVKDVFIMFTLDYALFALCCTKICFIASLKLILLWISCYLGNYNSSRGPYSNKLYNKEMFASVTFNKKKKHKTTSPLHQMQ